MKMSAAMYFITNKYKNKYKKVQKSVIYINLVYEKVFMNTNRTLHFYWHIPLMNVGKKIQLVKQKVFKQTQSTSNNDKYS